jgi:glutamate synthase (NADPH) small chain
MKGELEIKKLADFCVSCVTKPCQLGCPLNNDTTGFIKAVKNDNYEEAFKILSNTTVMPAICGKICPHEKQCQGSCVKRVSYEAVRIGDIESFIGDLAIENDWKFLKKGKKNKKILVVGSGPAGLTCAAFLAKEGYQVTLYEKHDYLGGLLYHGIPAFRLNKDLVKKAIDKILDLGIEVHTNMTLGKDFSLDEVKDKYDAIFLGIGANVSRMMEIPGENLTGVYGGNELLEKAIHPDYTDKKIFVIGGGNVAMDVARTVKRLGAKEVTILYRRDEADMPAEKVEIKETVLDDVEFLYKTKLVKILGEDKVQKIECIKTKLSDEEKYVDVEGSNFVLDADYVMMAIGSKADDDVLDSLGLERKENGYLSTNDNDQTSDEKIFAAGDLTGTKSTVAWACRKGRDAAYSIMEYLENK